MVFSASVDADHSLEQHLQAYLGFQRMPLGNPGQCVFNTRLARCGLDNIRVSHPISSCSPDRLARGELLFYHVSSARVRLNHLPPPKSQATCQPEKPGNWYPKTCSAALTLRLSLPPRRNLFPNWIDGPARKSLVSQYLPPGCSRRAGGKRPWGVRERTGGPDPKNVPLGSRVVSQKVNFWGQGNKGRLTSSAVRRRTGEYPPARLLPGGLPATGNLLGERDLYQILE